MFRKIVGFYLILYISLLFVSAVSLLWIIVATVWGVPVFTAPSPWFLTYLKVMLAALVIGVVPILAGMVFTRAR
jgi:hypothetical protein